MVVDDDRRIVGAVDALEPELELRIAVDEEGFHGTPVVAGLSRQPRPGGERGFTCRHAAMPECRRNPSSGGGRDLE
jgi:hypothetical protein